MRIGELAQRAGLSTDTIRYYERRGLLSVPARSQNRYRHYSADVMEDLEFIRKARASGLKLSDVRDVMQIADGGRAPCDHVRATITARLTEVEDRLKEQRSLRSTLTATLSRLDGAPTPKAGCRCAAIESS